MQDSLVTIATFNDATQAAIASQHLEQEGIKTFLMDAETVTMAWQLSSALGGVKLMVARENADLAEEILDRVRETVREEEAAARFAVQPGDPPGDPPAEPDLDDRPPSERELDAERAFKAAVFGLLCWPIMFLTIWLILKVIDSSGPMPARARRQFYIAVALVFVTFALVFVIGQSFLRIQL